MKRLELVTRAIAVACAAALGAVMAPAGLADPPAAAGGAVRAMAAFINAGYAGNAPVATVEGALAPPPFRGVRADGVIIIPGWRGEGLGPFAVDLDDPASPRFVGYYDPDRNGDDAASGLEEALGLEGLAAFSYEGPREIEAYPLLQSTRGLLAIGTARKGGETMVFTALLAERAPGDGLSAYIVYAPDEVYRSWGGASATLVAFGVIQDPSMFEADVLEAMRDAPLDRQLEMLEHVFNVGIQYFGDAVLTAMVGAQMNSIEMMTNLNYNINQGVRCIEMLREIC